MQYEGECARSKGDSSSYPNLLPSLELPLIQLPRQEMPCSAVTPLALSSLKDTRIPMSEPLEVPWISKSFPYPIINTKERHKLIDDKLSNAR